MQECKLQSHISSDMFDIFHLFTIAVISMSTDLFQRSKTNEKIVCAASMRSREKWWALQFESNSSFCVFITSVFSLTSLSALKLSVSPIMQLVYADIHHKIGAKHSPFFAFISRNSEQAFVRFRYASNKQLRHFLPLFRSFQTLDTI